ncbi:hypothetical protein GX441_08435 [bacterium]|nr:hypothetical protein [bacterium]
MRVYQRNQRWWVDFSYNGKRYRKAAGRTKRDALLKLGMIVERIKAEDTNEIAATVPRTFGEYVVEYFSIIKAEMIPENYRRASYKIRNNCQILRKQDTRWNHHYNDRTIQASEKIASKTCVGES